MSSKSPLSKRKIDDITPEVINGLRAAATSKDPTASTAHRHYEAYQLQRKALEALEQELEQKRQELAECQRQLSVPEGKNVGLLKQKAALDIRIHELEGTAGLITKKNHELTTLAAQFSKEFDDWQKSQVKVESGDFRNSQSAGPAPKSQQLVRGANTSDILVPVTHPEASQPSVYIMVEESAKTVHEASGAVRKLSDIQGALSGLSSSGDALTVKTIGSPSPQIAKQWQFFLKQDANQKMKAESAFQPKISIQTSKAISSEDFKQFGSDVSTGSNSSVKWSTEDQGNVATCTISEGPGEHSLPIMQMSHTLAVDDKPGKIDILLTETRQEKQDEALMLMVLAAKKALEKFGNANEFYIENCSNDPETALKLFVLGKSVGLNPVFRDGAEAAILASSKIMMTQDGTEKPLSDIYKEVKAMPHDTEEARGTLKNYMAGLLQEENPTANLKPRGPI